MRKGKRLQHETYGLKNRVNRQRSAHPYGAAPWSLSLEGPSFCDVTAKKRGLSYSTSPPGELGAQTPAKLDRPCDPDRWPSSGGTKVLKVLHPPMIGFEHRTGLLSSRMAALARRGLPKDRTVTNVALSPNDAARAAREISSFRSIMDDARRLAAFDRLGSDWRWETDVDERFTFFSLTSSNTGVHLESRIGGCRRDGAAQDPANLAHLESLEAIIARHESFRDFVYRAQLDTERPYWCSISGEPRYDRAGAFAGYLGVGRDVTASVETSSVLERKSVALDAILRAIPDGVRLIRNGMTLAINDQIYDILGIPNRGSHTDPAASLQSLMEMAERGEYGPADAATLAPQPADAMRQAVVSRHPVDEQRHLKTGRWVETRQRVLDDGVFLLLCRDVTEDKRRESELERQAALLSTIMSNIDSAIAVYDKDKRLAAWNDRFPTLLGIDPSLLKVGVSARELLISQARSGEFGVCDPEVEGERRLTAYFGDQPISGERTRPDGAVIHMRRNFVPGGGAVTIYMDVTDLRRIGTEIQELNTTLERRVVEGSHALTEKERFLRTLFESVPGMAYRSTNDGRHRMMFVSSGSHELLGLASEDLVDNGNAYRNLIDPRDREVVREKVRRDLATGDRFELEYRVRHADGSWRWVWDRARAVPSAHGTGTMEGFMLDITGRKEAEQELARLRDNLSDAVEGVDHGIILYDRQGQLILFNRRVLEQFAGAEDLIVVGTTFAEIFDGMIGRGLVPLAPGQTRAQLVAELLAPMLRADGKAMERAAPNGRTLLVSARPSRTGHLVSIGIDVTDRLEREQQLREAQRMEAMGQLTGGLAHDLNNYLAVIVGNLELLAERPGLDPQAPKLIANAISGVERGAELTKSLLAFSRRQPLDPVVLDIGPRITEVSRLVRRTIGERIVLDLRVAPDLWPVEIDGAQLDTAIVNLAVNARDAMPAGGTLTIEVHNVSHGASGSPSGDHVLIEVKDTGFGMTAETAAKAFEPFFTTKGPSHGTGLGLSMVHGFVHQSGGTVRLVSQVGEGTSACLFLPRSLLAPASMQATDTAGAQQRGAERILVVDDNADVRLSVCDQVRSLGYRVREADSGDAALAQLEADPGAFDLVFTDMVMPGHIDGLALATIVRQRWPALTVLLTSGYAVELDSTANRGAADFELLRKPYRKSALASALRQVLAKR
jgi:PAS domain S-box-containing protein